ncbi:MAG: hypothetical protein ABI832_16445 [bacterium]
MAEPAESIIFVVEDKDQETKSLLLAASLARHHRVGADVSLIAYVTEAALADLDPVTHALYERCGVRITQLPILAGVWAAPYPQGTRLLAAAMPRPSQRATVLVTDMICRARITDIAPGSGREVFAVPEDRRTWGKDSADWQTAYDFFNLPMPQERVTLTRGKNAESLPYFNTGFVSFPEAPLGKAGKTFGRLWLDAARHFDFLCEIEGKRPWLDQITLPLAMALHGVDCLLLPDSYNYSIAGRADLSAVPQAQVLRYDRPAVFHQLPDAAALLAALRDMLPARHRDGLDLLLAVHFDPVPAG